MNEILFGISIWLLPVLFAITLHEAAHGYVAWKLGDDTAKQLGRVSFNPLRHIDMWGTVIIPAVLLVTTSFVFGWAKPVPVDFGRLNNPRRDMVWVALAGPGINLAMAIFCAFMIHVAVQLPSPFDEWLFRNLRNAIYFNLILAVFNMIPLPPLDGGRVAVGLLPRYLAYQLAGMERYGLFIIIGILFLLPMIGREIGMNLNIFPWLIGGPVSFLIEIIAGVAGFR
ncbi:MAG: site-2 protease family protein [Rhodospirillales bacterium]|nr:site-2 protease family protein [Rhodospirillales bacterium]